MKLLNIDKNAKTVKGQKQGYMTAILYLAPADLSGFEVCPQRSAGCTEAYLNTAGRGAMSSVQQSRIAKTRLYFEDREAFMQQLFEELCAFTTKARKAGMVPCVRLNGTSDIPWERIRMKYGFNAMECFQDVQFYDYTKVTKRAVAHARGSMPSNYHLTFSATESNHHDVETVLSEGGNVSVVFRKELPDAWGGVPVIDGDENDLRFLDPKGVVVGLKAKGAARKDTSGFVHDCAL